MARKTRVVAIASIPDLSLQECLRILEKNFDCRAIARRKIDAGSVLEYYRQCDRGYRLFHSGQGAMHVAMNCCEQFSTDGYLMQVKLIAERLGQSRRILEVGCGTGYNLRNLAKWMPSCQFTGIDLSADHVSTAQTDGASFGNIFLHRGDFHAIPYGASAFEAVFAVECLCQGSDWHGAVAEVNRVLCPGGQFIVIDCFRQSPLSFYDDDLQFAAQLVEKTMAVEEFAVLEDWLQLARNSGFTVLEQIDLSDSISHNLARFYSLARRYFKMPMAARAFIRAFPPQLLENAISGLLMPFTVGGNVHRYYLLTLQKS